MHQKRERRKLYLLFYKTYRFYLIKFKMKLKTRILVGCGVALLLLVCLRVLDPEPDQQERMSLLEEQFWADLSLEYAKKNRSFAQLVVDHKPEFVESRKRTQLNASQDTSELVHPAYKETIYSLDRPDHNSSRQVIVDWLLQQYNVDWDMHLSDSPWKIAAGWVNEHQVMPDYAPELGAILNQMATRKISRADVGVGGTQLKMQLTLEGSQKVVFKPKWYSRDYIITGTPYAGKDRHNGEIATFHLNRILGLNRSPLVVGRRVNFETDIIPVATADLLKTIYLNEKNVCFYGKCLYCKDESTGVCGDDTVMEGVLVLWLPPSYPLSKKIKHPWSRTYRSSRKARWETQPDGYCDAVKRTPAYGKYHPRILMDIIDAAVSDYIVGDGDRHHIEIFKNYNNSIVVMLDNGKSFGNPTWDVDSILAPLQQCCQLRAATWERLLLLRRGILGQVLQTLLNNDPISPVVDKSHYVAVDRRLENVVKVVGACSKKYGKKYVFVKDIRS